MKSVCRLLSSIFYGSIAVCVILILLGELHLVDFQQIKMPVLTEFYVNVVMELVTICFIPLALRFFKVGKIHRDLLARKEKALRVWGTLRMTALCLPMVLNTVFYYITHKAAYAYMAIILFLCLSFVLPTMARCWAEVTPNDE